MREIEPPSSKPSLATNPDIVRDLLPPPPKRSEAQAFLCSTEVQQQQTPVEQGRAAEQLGLTALQAGRYADARRHFAQAITMLQGQVPDVQLMPLLRNQVSASLESNAPISDVLCTATPTQVIAALPHLQRLVTIGQANAPAVDGQDGGLRTDNLMNLAFAQVRLRQYQTGADNYLAAIQLLENVQNPSPLQRQSLRTCLNNYTFALQELPVTNARTQEIDRRIAQYQALQGQ